MMVGHTPPSSTVLLGVGVAVGYHGHMAIRYERYANTRLRARCYVYVRVVKSLQVNNAAMGEHGVNGIPQYRHHTTIPLYNTSFDNNVI